MTTTPESATGSPGGTAPGPVARTADRLATRVLGLPPARTGWTRRDERTAMSDGAVLLADHYLPATAHPLGTVLIRTPYGRRSVQYLTSARALAARGYHVLVQSCRGTFGSGGTFEPMVHEADDGRDTVAWLREQSWFDGRLATFGASYLGWTQWTLLADPPPELRAAVVVVGPHDFAEAVHGTGAFSLNDFLAWSDLVARQEDGGQLRAILRSATGARRLARACAGLPLGAAAETVLAGRAPWYRDWVGHPDRTHPFWDRLRAADALERAGVPVLLVGGWQDLFIDQTVRQYEALRARGADVALTVGPWIHMDVIGRGAGVIIREALDWFDENLADATPRRRAEPVRIHVTGAGEWRDLPQWPPSAVEHVRHLRPRGVLGRSRPGGGPVATFRYDPADPTPTVGGRLLTTSAGVRDNRPLEARPDVVTFTTEPLGRALEVVGEPVVELEHTTDNPHADVFVRLCDVDRRGRSRNFTEALVRLDPDRTSSTVTVRLDPCAHRVAAGHRLRLLVAGGSHPRFARNTGTGEAPVDATALVGSTHTVHAGRVVVPVAR